MDKSGQFIRENLVRDNCRDHHVCILLTSMCHVSVHQYLIVLVGISDHDVTGSRGKLARLVRMGGAIPDVIHPASCENLPIRCATRRHLLVTRLKYIRADDFRHCFCTR